MDAKATLDKARKLIQAKRYEDARALLLTVDHPTADKWLTRLNAMPTAPAGTGKADDEKKKSQDTAIGCLVIIAIVMVLAAIGAVAGGGEPGVDAPPEEVIRHIVDGEVITDIDMVTYNETDKFLHAAWDINSFGDVGYEERQMLKIVCKLRDRFPDHRMMMSVVVTLADALGNTSEAYGLSVELSASTVTALNCDNLHSIRLRDIASVYDLHYAMQ